MSFILSKSSNGSTQQVISGHTGLLHPCIHELHTVQLLEWFHPQNFWSYRFIASMHPAPRRVPSYCSCIHELLLFKMVPPIRNFWSYKFIASMSFILSISSNGSTHK
ncbi:hypothetical protein CDAR_499021 [Caerostris darwini]|uniref:Uncharacterized protein n=1 Tax=Caerostris darwini TaxID=1538125 RepID=A0AAV4T518_9ARAC|nr:hypothetical protein CDAR_499021 [Caerostris darwini]